MLDDRAAQWQPAARPHVFIDNAVVEHQEGAPPRDPNIDLDDEEIPF